MVSPLIVSLKKRKKLYGSKIDILSPAKINLYLNIVGEYPNGFHHIESIFERISLLDSVSIEAKKDPSVDITSNFKSIAADNNLCVKAAKLMKKTIGIPFGFKIGLKKRIPMGSGLGGGSSNAASTLLGINELIGLNLGKKELYGLGAKLGSDVNFFISESKFAFIKGRGNEVFPLDIADCLKHFIVWPRIQISTKEVYSAAKLKLTKFFNNVKILQYALKKRDAFLVEKSSFNALAKTAFSISNELKQAKRYLDRNGFCVKLTGSGSAFYTLFDKRRISEIRGILPKDWLIFNVTTF